MSGLLASSPATASAEPDQAYPSCLAGNGFNLLPHRRWRARLARRRAGTEAFCAVLAGLGLVVALGTWQQRSTAPGAVRRAALEQTLARLAPALAEHARRDARAAQQAKRMAAQAPLEAQRERLILLLDALARQAAPKIRLSEIHYRAQDTSIRGHAASRAAFEQWYAALAQLPGLESVTVTALRGSDPVPGKVPGPSLARAAGRTEHVIASDMRARAPTARPDNDSGDEISVSAGDAWHRLAFDVSIRYRAVPDAALAAKAVLAKSAR